VQARAPARIPEVDGLRALAMSAVVAQHCGLAPFGWTGVWLFFVISGYVISRNFILQEYVAGHWTAEYRIFVLRRFFRIVPVYALYVAVGLLILVAMRKLVSLRDAPFLLTFTYNWQMIFELWPNPQDWSAFGHLWTLSVEEQFYLAYPLLFLLLPRRRYVAALLVLVVVGPLLRYGYVEVLDDASSDGGWIAFAVYAASFAHFDAFLLGALIANFERDIRARPALANVLLAAALVAVVAYALCYVQVNRADGASGLDALRNIFSGILYGDGRAAVVYTVVDLAAAAALVYAILQKPITRPLRWPAVTLVGRISYGGYLYHAFVTWLIASLITPIGTLPVVQRIGWFVVAWCLTVALAYLSYRWFETPIIRWSRSAHAGPARAVAPGSRS
jgi:peptidoglycan/LPS O-acetylase OafA/YrhL